MNKLSRIAATVTSALVLAGCGGGGTTPTSSSSTTHCTPANSALSCNLPPAPPSNPFQSQSQRAVAHGIDFGWGGPPASFYRSRGLTFGASYLSTDPSKDWRASQVREYAAHGISRVFVWETSATRALGGCSAGASDARSAVARGFPLGARVLYFAVDFELQSSEAGTVASYFRCADRVVGVSRVGAYGGIQTVRVLFNSRLIRYGWQTYAWSGGQWDSRAQLQQYQNGSSVDLDRAVSSDYGQTPFATPKPKRPMSAQKRELRRLLGAFDKRTNPHGHNCQHPPYKHAYPSARFNRACGIWAQEVAR